MEENSDKIKELLNQVEDQFHENSANSAENNSISNRIRKGASRKRKLSSSSSASSPSTVRRTSSRRQKTTYNDDSTDNNFDN